MINLEELVSLAEEQLGIENEISDLEDAIKDAKLRFRKVSESDIPEAMGTLGVDSIKLLNGRQIQIVKKYSATISMANKVKALQWLRENGFGGLIKRKVGAEFGKGDDEQAAHLLSELGGRNLYVYDDANVHHSTLRAFVKEQMEMGSNLPEELFGVYVVNRATIK